MLNSYQNTRIAKLSSKRKGFLIALGRQLQTMHQPISHLLFRAKTFFKGVESLMGRGDLFYKILQSFQLLSKPAKWVTTCFVHNSTKNLNVQIPNSAWKSIRFRREIWKVRNSDGRQSLFAIYLKIFLISLSNFNKLPWKWKHPKQCLLVKKHF